MALSLGSLIAFIGLRMNAKKLSFGGLQKLKELEGSVRGTSGLHIPYKDSADLWTIGYGHLIKENEDFGEGIPDDQADALLAHDVKVAENVINANVKVPLTQNEFDALVMFTFNVGNNAFKNSTLLRKLNAGDKQGAADELLRWTKITLNGEKINSAGLAYRRDVERDYFLA